MHTLELKYYRDDMLLNRSHKDVLLKIRSSAISEMDEANSLRPIATKKITQSC